MAKGKRIRKITNLYQDVIPDFERMTQKRRMAYLQAVFLLEYLQERKKNPKDPP